LKIAVDVMSGDFPPEILIEGAVQAVNAFNVQLIVVGKADLIEKKLKTMKFDSRLIEIENAEEVILMTDDPVTGFKTKKDSSIIKCAQLVKQEKAAGFFSPGNTGATLITSLFINGRLKGISRPAISTFIPTVNGTPQVLLDAGANLECNVNNLLQFAVMGSSLIKKYFGIANPKVGLINIGEESTKGSDILQKTYKALEKLGMDFIGNIESSQTLDGKANVLITDGFTGNILIKSIEGTFKSLIKIATKEIKKSIFYQTGALMMKSALQNINRILSADEYGAAPLLGVNAVCMIGHGHSRQKDIKSGIRVTMQYVEKKVNSAIVETIKEYRLNKIRVPYQFWHMSDFREVPLEY
jgi:phosphate acyltransferase